MKEKPTIAELEAVLASDDDLPITIKPDGSIHVIGGCAVCATEQSIAWPDPTPAMLDNPVFNAIWNVIKTWDVAVPGAYYGYCGATGNHARAIYDAIHAKL